MVTGETDDLQFEVILIRPEPGDLNVRMQFAAQRCRSGFGLFLSVVYRFKSKPAAQDIVWMTRAISDRQNIRVAGSAILVDYNSIINFKTSSFRDFYGWLDANAYDHHIGRQFRSIA